MDGVLVTALCRVRDRLAQDQSMLMEVWLAEVTASASAECGSRGSEDRA